MFYVVELSDGLHRPFTSHEDARRWLTGLKRVGRIVRVHRVN